jgi:arylsulfatase A-like enzyme
VTRRGFASQLSVSALAVLAALVVESALSAAALVREGWGQAALGFVWSLGLGVLPALLCALLAAAALTALLEADSLRNYLRQRWLGDRGELVGLLVAAALFVAATLGLALVSSRFHNAELAAAGLALLSLVSAGLAALVGLGVARWSRGDARRGRWALAFGVALGGAVSIWLELESRSGLRQLDARLWAPPAALLAVFWLADSSLRVRALGRRAFGLAALGGALAWSAFLLGGPRATLTVESHGPWSRYLVSFLRAASDIDRDGYSSFLGGGDCAPFDPAVSPGAAEIVGDGIDNNCIGGDAGRSAKPRRPSWGSQVHGSLTNLDVVVVTIETLRRDHASFVGAARDTTPELRELGREALVFERMYSAAPLTRLAIASLFSSYAASEIDWLPQARDKRMRHLGPKTPWLPELLQARGYETIAVLSDFSAFTGDENAGFERGFQRYDSSTKLQYRGGTMWGFPAAEQVDKALAYVAQARRPFLLWLHLFEPHYMYEQPPDAPVFGADEQSRYDAEIWHVDHQLGRLVRELRRLGVWDSTVLFVSGDHGEAFGEHGDRWHGSNLFDPQLRPAALLRVPGVPGRRISEPTSFTDVAPTLARVLGDRKIFDQLHGRSLTPLLHHAQQPLADRGFVAESFSVDDGHAYQAAFIDFPLKLIYVEDGRRFSFFDLAEDPGELAPLDPAADPRAAPLMRELVGYLERARPRSLGAAR